ncbi:uncharacterized protein Z519_05134 [Cladophialophora bantiana CBS 173.52]|uniref:chitin deacetylase n=1 Tax=Cladophialophora bantiana (strain ATCC 10958 / CBS 173.52 / CDC B-1940 / NIH 8579) TaxID=1442370 RepID=A0A0D2IAK1_CLAB1|nr:uncharacterized protein Z519_05134 [Cladophialophora bantiana CBS 173.52]KIW93819.1 hypothetical protein Z519_05134 [Cladophialophora bantiana CBS 173.52]
MTAVFITVILFSLAISSLISILYKPPKWLICWLQARYPSILFYVPTDEKIVALTIDDGPSPYTLEIQRVLKAHGVKATFFVIGSRIPGREEILRELVMDGHELANHAMHDEPSVRIPPEELARQIQAVERQIEDIYASVLDLDLSSAVKPPRYFRPGSGFFNAGMLSLLEQPYLKYKLVLGSIYPWDAQIPWAKLNAWHILGSMTPGATIVIHDRKWTAPMLRVVLSGLKRRGWSVGTVTDLLGQSTEAI